MSNTVLFEQGSHKNILLEDFSKETFAVQANQHLIIHNGQGMLLDPGGHKVYSRALAETLALLQNGSLQYLFFSHQDPDIVAAMNGWLMTTEAEAYISKLWARFVPHFGIDYLMANRLHAIPDEGMRLTLGGAELLILPAHFLHSTGNFHVYDPSAKILYSGDLGASLGMNYTEVTDFAAHIPYMEAFHRRYMASNKAMRAWAAMVRQLDIAIIAPQHGAFFKGKALVQQFIDWCTTLECGVDLIADIYQLPGNKNATLSETAPARRDSTPENAPKPLWSNLIHNLRLKK